MIPKGSRYEGVDITGIKTRDGTVRKFLHDRRIFSAEDVGNTAREHTVEGEETIDSIAALYYDGDESLYFLIADVNDILFPMDLEPGMVLIIPDPDIRTKVTK